MIVYNPTINAEVEIPDIEGYKKQFSINIPEGETTEENKQPQIIYIQQEQPAIEQPQEVVEIQKPEEKKEETPKVTIPSEWSDIKSIIRKNEGFVSNAKKMFNEPNASIGYGFFDRLPDGRKIFSGMTMTKDEADKQLDIAINKLGNQVQGYLNKYNVKTSPEQFNVLLDLGYHGGAGLVEKLLKESGGDSAKIGSLLTRYATKAKYGDKSISDALKKRALRRAEGWNKYTLKGRNGLKLPKFQQPASKLPDKQKIKKFLSNLGWALSSSGGSPTSATGGDPYTYQNNKLIREGKVKEAQENQKQLDKSGATAVAASLTVPLMAGEFSTYGLLGGGLRLGAGIAGSKIGEESLGAVGNYIDTKAGTNWVGPTGKFIGGFAGYGVAQAPVNAGLRKLAGKGITMHMPQETFMKMRGEDFTRSANKIAKNAEYNPIQQLVLQGKLGWAPASKENWFHHSDEPITKFKIPFNERWDVVKHGANPRGVFLTKDPGTGGGMMADRKYHLKFSADVKKPMVQVGDVKQILGAKNNTRNAIVNFAENRGADGMIFKGIEDNKLHKQDILFTFNHPEAQIAKTYQTPERTYWGLLENKSNLSSAEKAGLTKQERNSPIRDLHRVVNRDGTINEKELLKTYHKVLKENPISIRANEPYQSGNEISSLRKHLTGVVKTAQTIPVPKGSSRAELVRAALIHDIGKLTTGQESLHGEVLHPLVGKNIIATTLKGTEFDTPALRAATRYHMYQNGRLGTFNRHGVKYENDPLTGQMKVNYDLIRALQTADVSRGLPYDKAAAKFPQLFTYAKENPVKVNFAHGDVDWELKNVVNPILKKEGYPTVSLKKNIGDQLNSVRERHRSVLRGIRDPLKQPDPDDFTLFQDGAIRNAKNASENAVRFYGEDTPLNRMLVSAQRISSAPTGYGRADLFKVTTDHNGLPTHKPNWLADYLKIDPKTQDAVYVSGSSDILDTYSNLNGSASKSNLRTRLTLPFEKLKEQEHLPDFMERTDFQLYDGAAIHKSESPMSFWQKYELPYRLQTGRSMQKDMLDEFSYIFGEPNFGGSKKIAGSKLIDPESFEAKSLLNWKNNSGSLANFLDKMGVKFDPIKQIDGKIMTNYKGSDLMRRYNTMLMSAEQRPFDFIHNYGDRLIADGVLTDKQVKTLKHITNNLSKKHLANSTSWHPGMGPQVDPYADQMRQQLEKYIFNKNFAYKFKDLFYKTVKPTYRFKSDADYVSYINDEENWINFMRRHGVSPVWEMPNFGKTSLISTNGGRWGSKPATRNKPITGSASPQAIIVGDLNEKAFDVTGMDSSKVWVGLKKYRDAGNRYLSEDFWPITRKTYRLGGKIWKTLTPR